MWIIYPPLSIILSSVSHFPLLLLYPSGLELKCALEKKVWECPAIGLITGELIPKNTNTSAAECFDLSSF